MLPCPREVQTPQPIWHSKARAIALAALSLFCAAGLIACAATPIQRSSAGPQSASVQRIETTHGHKARVAPGEEFGVVFGSLGSAGNDSHLQTRRIMFGLMGENIGAFWGGGAGATFVTGAFAGIYSSQPDSEFQLLPAPAAPAKVTAFAFKVRPGSYELASLDVSRHSDKGPSLANDRGQTSDLVLTAIPFTVRPGQATYLGQFLSAVGTAGGAKTTYFIITDEQKRDQPAAIARGVPIEGRVESLVPSILNAGVRAFASQPLPTN